jgi:hypothetical protein
MKIVLWSALCGLCILAGQVMVGMVAFLLLMGCVHVRNEPHYDYDDRAEREESLV